MYNLLCTFIFLYFRGLFRPFKVKMEILFLLNFRTSVFLFEPPSAILSVLCPWVLMTVIQYGQLCAHILSPQDLKCLHKKDGVITRYDLFPNNDMPKVLLVQCSIEVVEPRRGGAE